MPSVSQSQQRLMGMAWAYSQGKLSLKDMPASMKEKVKDLAKNMKEKDLSDFAHTPRKELPEKITNIVDDILKTSAEKLKGKVYYWSTSTGAYSSSNDWLPDSSVADTKLEKRRSYATVDEGHGPQYVNKTIYMTYYEDDGAYEMQFDNMTIVDIKKKMKSLPIRNKEFYKTKKGKAVFSFSDDYIDVFIKWCQDNNYVIKRNPSVYSEKDRSKQHWVEKETLQEIQSASIVNDILKEAGLVDLGGNMKNVQKIAKEILSAASSAIKNKVLEIRKLISDEPLDYQQFLQTDSSYKKFKALKLLHGSQAKEFEQEWNIANNSTDYYKALNDVLDKFKIPELFKKQQLELEKENNKKIDSLKQEIFRTYPILKKIENQTTDGDIAFISGYYTDKNYIHLEFDEPWTSGYDNEYRKSDFSEKDIAQLKEYVSMFSKRKLKDASKKIAKEILAVKEFSLIQEYIKKNKFLDEKTKFKTQINGKKLKNLIKKVYPAFRIDVEDENLMFDEVTIITDEDPAIYEVIFFGGNDSENVLDIGISMYKDSPYGYDIDNESDKYQRTILPKIKKWNKLMEDIYNYVKRNV